MRRNQIVARNAAELANVLGLTLADAVEMELHCEAHDRIIVAMRRSHLTQAQVAKAAGTSRSRVAAVVNRSRGDISTDLLLRILAALGYRVKFVFTRKRSAE